MPLKIASWSNGVSWNYSFRPAALTCCKADMLETYEHTWWSPWTCTVAKHSVGLFWQMKKVLPATAKDKFWKAGVFSFGPQVTCTVAYRKPNCHVHCWCLWADFERLLAAIFGRDWKQPSFHLQDHQETAPLARMPIFLPTHPSNDSLQYCNKKSFYRSCPKEHTWL